MMKFHSIFLIKHCNNWSVSDLFINNPAGTTVSTFKVHDVECAQPQSAPYQFRTHPYFIGGHTVKGNFDRRQGRAVNVMG
jgi:hypothetical protein